MAPSHADRVEVVADIAQQHIAVRTRIEGRRTTHRGRRGLRNLKVGGEHIQSTSNSYSTQIDIGGCGERRSTTAGKVDRPAKRIGAQARQVDGATRGRDGGHTAHVDSTCCVLYNVAIVGRYGQQTAGVDVVVDIGPTRGALQKNVGTTQRRSSGNPGAALQMQICSTGVDGSTRQR